MCQMGDLFLGALALGDILMGCHPSAVGQRFVDDVDRTAVRGLDNYRGSLPDITQDFRTVFVGIACERSGCFTVDDDLAESAARLDNLCRQSVHLNITL